MDVKLKLLFGGYIDIYENDVKMFLDLMIWKIYVRFEFDEFFIKNLLLVVILLVRCYIKFYLIDIGRLY